MAMFDDLHTGNSGMETTFGNEEVSETIKEAIAEQQRELADLMPNVEQLRTTLDAEIAAISDIRSYINALGDNPDWKAIRDEYHARELHIAMIQRMRAGVDAKVYDTEQELGNG